MYRSSPFRSTLNTRYITCLDMCKVCTEAVHSLALWTRVTSLVWTCVKYVPKQSIPWHFENVPFYTYGFQSVSKNFYRISARSQFRMPASVSASSTSSTPGTEPPSRCFSGKTHWTNWSFNLYTFQVNKSSAPLMNQGDTPRKVAGMPGFFWGCNQDEWWISPLPSCWFKHLSHELTSWSPRSESRN